MKTNITNKVWSVIDIINWGTSYFEQSRIESPRLNIELILTKVLECKRIDLYMQFDKPLQESELADIKVFVRQRAEGKPIQYIIGEVEFYNTLIKVNESVLIPRPETEIMVDLLIQDVFKSDIDWEPVVLDIGTGSGNIAIALAKQIAKCRLYAFDKSERALETAKKNAELNKVAEKINFFRADIMENWIRKSELEFDYIVSNPPYISYKEKEAVSKEVTDYEPAEALFAGEDGTEYYDRIISYFGNWLKPGGKIFMELGINQAEKVNNMLETSGFKEINIKNDYHNIPRVINAVRTSKKNNMG